MRTGVEHKLRINYEKIRDKLKHDREIVASAINKFPRNNLLQMWRAQIFIALAGRKVLNCKTKDFSNTIKKAEREQWRDG